MKGARPLIVAGLLSFNGGFVDVVCFFGLKGLLAAHITGNLATLAASIVLGTAGMLSKIMAVPEFMTIVAITHVTARVLNRYRWPAAHILLGLEAVLLAVFLALAIRFGPFKDPDTGVALATGLIAIAAMAVQNGVQRAHLLQVPPTTFMTGNATQASVDFVDVLAAAADARQKQRLVRTLLNLGCFAFGCAIAAAAFWQIGFWAVAITLPLAVAAAVLTP
jgi:uncharacterized membrane protein YoaK (UPF0700 family)